MESPDSDMIVAATETLETVAREWSQPNQSQSLEQSNNEGEVELQVSDVISETVEYLPEHYEVMREQQGQEYSSNEDLNDSRTEDVKSLEEESTPIESKVELESQRSKTPEKIHQGVPIVDIVDTSHEVDTLPVKAGILSHKFGIFAH